MPKHNNAIPRNHFRKHWNPESSQKGHVKTFFNQPLQKKARRVKRQAKAKAIFPRPVSGPIRPVVQSNTQRYNMKSRSGRGFSLREIKAAGLNPRFARTIGIAVDHRRHNHSDESLSFNTDILKHYLSKLILYPLAGKKKATAVPGVTVAQPDALATVQQNSFTSQGPQAPVELPRDLTSEEKSRHIYNYLRAKKRDEKFIGIRLARKVRAEKKKESK